jgi:hypothetical protein
MDNLTLIKRICYLLTLTVLWNSCSKVVPAAFWTKYQKNFLLKNISNQGPRGGYRVMYWKTKDENTFEKKDLIDFATKNGWTFVESSFFPVHRVKTWTLFEKNIFPLSSQGFDPHLNFVTSEFKNFPRWTQTGLHVLSFKTGWVSIEPGSDDSNEINGFVIISEKRQELSVYHLWGE